MGKFATIYKISTTPFKHKTNETYCYDYFFRTDTNLNLDFFFWPTF